MKNTNKDLKIPSSILIMNLLPLPFQWLNSKVSEKNT